MPDQPLRAKYWNPLREQEYIMKKKLLFGTGMAAGYVLGSRSGRAAYEKIKARAAAIWDSKPVQEKVAAATEVVKEKAPEVSDQLTEAARRAGTVISSAIHRDGSKSPDSDGHKAEGASDAGPDTVAVMGVETSVPAHSTHPETVNLGTSDVDSDPALNAVTGQDWTDEGGATPTGAATNGDPGKST
jgi:hypothetical protein